MQILILCQPLAHIILIFVPSFSVGCSHRTTTERTPKRHLVHPPYLKNQQYLIINWAHLTNVGELKETLTLPTHTCVLCKCNIFCDNQARVYKKPCPTQLSMKFFLLINVKMPTISILGLSEPEKKLFFFIFSYLSTFKYSCLDELSMKKFYSLEPMSFLGIYLCAPNINN